LNYENGFNEFDLIGINSKKKEENKGV